MTSGWVSPTCGLFQFRYLWRGSLYFDESGQCGGGHGLGGGGHRGGGQALMLHLVLVVLVMMLLLLVAIVRANLGHLAGFPLDLHKSVRRVGLLMVMVLQGSGRRRGEASELIQLQMGGMGTRMRYCRSGRHQKSSRCCGGAQNVGGTAAGARIKRGHRVAVAVHIYVWLPLPGISRLYLFHYISCGFDQKLNVHYPHTQTHGDTHGTRTHTSTGPHTHAHSLHFYRFSLPLSDATLATGPAAIPHKQMT